MISTWQQPCSSILSIRALEICPTFLYTSLNCILTSVCLFMTLRSVGVRTCGTSIP